MIRCSFFALLKQESQPPVRMNAISAFISIRYSSLNLFANSTTGTAANSIPASWIFSGIRGFGYDSVLFCSILFFSLLLYWESKRNPKNRK